MHVPGLGTLETPVADLEILARMIIASGSTGKEGAGTVDSLRYVWTGKKNAGIREKERKERGKELIEVQKERARDRERTEAAKRRDTIDGKQMKSDGEEGGSGFGVPGLLWKGKLFGSRYVLLCPEDRVVSDSFCSAWWSSASIDRGRIPTYSLTLKLQRLPKLPHPRTCLR